MFYLHIFNIEHMCWTSKRFSNSLLLEYQLYYNPLSMAGRYPDTYIIFLQDKPEGVEQPPGNLEGVCVCVFFWVVFMLLLKLM